MFPNTGANKSSEQKLSLINVLTKLKAQRSYLGLAERKGRSCAEHEVADSLRPDVCMMSQTTKCIDCGTD